MMGTLTAIAGVIAAITLIVTNLTALYKSVQASGAIKLIQDRLNSHDQRIQNAGSEIQAISLAIEPKK